MVVVFLDVGWVCLVDMWIDKIGCQLVIIYKCCDLNKVNEIIIYEVVGEVEGKICLFVDDMVDIVGMMCQVVLVFKKYGVKWVIVVVIYLILLDLVVEWINNLFIEEFIVINIFKICDDIDIFVMMFLFIVLFIVKVIQEVFEDGFVMSLFC